MKKRFKKLLKIVLIVIAFIFFYFFIACIIAFIRKKVDAFTVLAPLLIESMDNKFVYALLFF